MALACDYDRPVPSDPSPLEEAVARVGDRWSLLIIEALLAGPRRFGELAEAVSGISPNILSQRLKALERDAVVVARPYSRRPPRAIYELSAAGRELAGAVRLLAQWGARGTDDSGTPRHVTCGTPLEARWYCPTCSRAVADDQAGELRYL